MSNVSNATLRDSRAGCRLRERPDGGVRRRRGSSLIEVLVALTILAIMMVGILQMFTLSMFVNAGASARTIMILRSQQVVENIRLAAHLARVSASTSMIEDLLGATGTAWSGSGATFAFIQGDYDLPYTTSDPNWATQFPAWGPDGANVIEGPDGEFSISIRIDVQTPADGFPALAPGSPNLRTGYLIRVTCTPKPLGGAGKRFFGSFENKRIDYASQIIL